MNILYKIYALMDQFNEENYSKVPQYLLLDVESYHELLMTANGELLDQVTMFRTFMGLKIFVEPVAGREFIIKVI